VAALKRLDISRLSEIRAVFTRFIKHVMGGLLYIQHVFSFTETIGQFGNSVSEQKHRNSHKRWIRAFCTKGGFDIVFTCFLVTPIGNYTSALFRGPGSFAATAEAIWN
jgi:hypothetical protein